MLNRTEIKSLSDDSPSNITNNTKSELVSRVSIHHLPIETMLLLLSYLIPEMIVKKILPLGKTFTEKIKNHYLWQLLWEKKFELHFPHIFPFKIKIKDQKIDWYKEFISRYIGDYGYISKKEALIFSLIKEKVRFYNEQNNSIQLSFNSLTRNDRFEKTLLTWAQMNNDQPTLDYLYELVKKDYSLNPRTKTERNDYSSTSILYWAIASHQSRDEIANLMSQGSQLDERYFNNHLPIHVAVEAGNLDILMFILETNPAFLNVANRAGKTPLMLAAAKGQVSIIKYLIQQNGIDLEATSLCGQHDHYIERTALFLACEYGRSEVVSELLKAYANATIPLVYMNFRPIHYAAMGGHLEVIKTFFKLRPELIDVQDAYGQTAFLWAASKGHAHVVEYLLSIKEQINVYASTQADTSHSNNGKTAMHWAAEKGEKEVVKLLLQAGIDATLAVGFNRLQPIHLAVSECKLNVVKTLMKHQPQLINQTDFYGRTPLILAVEHCSYDTIIYLLSKKECDLHARSRHYFNEDNNNKTALHYAAEKGLSEIVNLLLQHGARVDLAKPIDKSRLTESMRKEIERRERNLRNVPYSPFSFFGSSFGSAHDRLREESASQVRFEKRPGFKS